MGIKSILTVFLIITIIISAGNSAIFTVSASEEPVFPNIRIKSGFSLKVKLDNPDSAKYTVKIKNTKIAKQITKCRISKGNTVFKIKGLSKGRTVAKVFSKGKQIGKFKINVYIADATLKESCKNLTLKYNSHGSSVYMTNCHIYAEDLVKYKHPKAEYSALSDDYNIVNHTNDGLIYTVNKGTTQLKIYEKIGKADKRALGTVNITVKEAKMASVASENEKFYPEGIFGKGNKYECVYTGESLRIQGRIKECLINNKYTGSAFKKSQYKITYKSSNKKIATVNKVGKITGKKEGSTNIRYKIRFSDKSYFTGSCHISVLSNTVI